jgi:polyphosphate kinase
LNTRFDPELSRLAFEDRLIEYCEDERIPVLERVRLLAIVGERLDVFFMTRVGRLKRRVPTGEQKRSAHATPAEQLAWIAAEGNRIMRRSYRLLDELLVILARSDIGIDRLERLADEDREYVRRMCRSRLGALITPVTIEPTDEFPHVRNLRPALVAAARRRQTGSPCLVVVELPADLPRLVPLKHEHRFVPLEQVIAAELPTLCPELDVEAAHLFRVTRNASTEFDDDDEAMSDVEEEIVQRPFQEVVRLEVEHGMPDAIRERLRQELQCEDPSIDLPLVDQDVYVVDGLLDLTVLEELAKLDLPKLKSKSVEQRARRVDYLLDAAATDVLLHFPVDDYETSLEQFLRESARHPELESIHTTIYRTDRNSEVTAALRIARARGADVSAVVELKASFDEQENIDLARVLEADGVRVVLSPASLKVHAKIALVTFRDAHGPRRVALIGTGNMNALTARSYIDLWLVTRDPARTAEVAALFGVLVSGAAIPTFDCILVAPFDMRHRFLELIEREIAHATAGRPSGIRVMMNGLTDPAVIAALYRASQAGVAIDMMIRGVCLLRPGAPDISENIRIVSVAGRLLQHARIIHFRNGGEDEYFIGSADWRPRNFDSRVEVVTGVRQADHKASLDRILTETLSARDAWVIGSDGIYVRDSARGLSSSDQGNRTYVTLTPS